MPRNSAAYDNDFYAWTQEQASLLRSGQLSQVDTENVAEEMEDMGRSIRRELRNRMAVLMMHLLKWRHQPGYRSPSWAGTIAEQRSQIVDLLDESPSLKQLPERDLAKIYKLAIPKAIRDTGFSKSAFPPECPFTAEQLLAEDFLPED